MQPVIPFYKHQPAFKDFFKTEDSCSSSFSRNAEVVQEISEASSDNDSDKMRGHMGVEQSDIKKEEIHKAFDRLERSPSQSLITESVKNLKQIMSVTILMHDMNQFVRSGIELTKVIVETERMQNAALDRKTILEIYSQSMTSIGKSIGNMSKEL